MAGLQGYVILLFAAMALSAYSLPQQTNISGEFVLCRITRLRCIFTTVAIAAFPSYLLDAIFQVYSSNTGERDGVGVLFEQLSKRFDTPRRIVALDVAGPVPSVPISEFTELGMALFS